jgi:hypothetical protein
VPFVRSSDEMSAKAHPVEDRNRQVHQHPDREVCFAGVQGVVAEHDRGDGEKRCAERNVAGGDVPADHRGEGHAGQDPADHSASHPFAQCGLFGHSNVCHVNLRAMTSPW